MVIVIGSYRGSPWLQQCIDSIPSKWETIVVRNGGYECGTLSWVMKNTDLDRWLYLQDSTRINDASWLDEIDEFYGSVSLLYDPGWFGSFLGLYRRDVLEVTGIPETPTKMQAVLAELSLGQAYEKEEPSRKILWPELRMNSARFEAIHGREIAIYENRFFTKYKGTWNGDMITPAQERDDAHKLRYP